MPAILGLDVAALAVGLLAMLAALAVAWLIRGIGNLIGNLSIGPFTYHLGAKIAGLGSDIESWAVQHGKQWWHTISAWFVNMGFTLYHTFLQALQATFHLGRQIEYLNTTVIPQKIHHAQAQSNGHASVEVRKVEHQLHSAALQWDKAHSIADAHHYIALEHHHPSVAHAMLATAATGLLAGESAATAGEHALRDYIDRELAKQRTKTASLEHAVGIALPAEIAGVRTAVKAITSEFERCAVTKCAGPNQFSKLLQDALGIASAVDIGQFIAEAVQHPATAAADFAAQVQGVENLATEAFDTLVHL